MANGVDIQARLQEVRSRVQQVRPGLLQQAQQAVQQRQTGRLMGRVRSQIQSARGGRPMLKDMIGGDALGNILPGGGSPDAEMQQAGFRGTEEESNNQNTGSEGGFRGVPSA